MLRRLLGPPRMNSGLESIGSFFTALLREWRLRNFHEKSRLRLDLKKTFFFLSESAVVFTGTARTNEKKPFRQIETTLPFSDFVVNVGLTQFLWSIIQSSFFFSFSATRNRETFLQNGSLRVAIRRCGAKVQPRLRCNTKLARDFLLLLVEF